MTTTTHSHKAWTDKGGHVIFAKRHHRAFGAALDLELPKAACDSTFLYQFELEELEELLGLLRERMLSQVSDRDKDFDQLICDGKTL